MRYNDKNADVKAVQQALIEQGYALPLYGADGHLGEESWDALQRYSDDQALSWNPQVPTEVLEQVRRRDSTRPDIPILLPPDQDYELYDLRAEQAKPSPKSRVVGGATVRRNPQAVTGITIHQMAVNMGLAKYQIEASDGDKVLARARRGLNIACHVATFRDGSVAWTNELDRYIYHGNGYNRSTLGIEIEGSYPGLINGPTWNGKAATELTEEGIHGACQGLRLLVEEGRKIGMPIRNVYAHRQASATRRSDPGESIWKHIVLDYAVAVLGLTAHQSETVGKGRPIPAAWDPKGVGAY